MGYSPWSCNKLDMTKQLSPELTSNVVLVLGVQQSDSVIHIHVSTLCQFLFPFRLPQDIESVPCAIQ